MEDAAGAGVAVVLHVDGLWDPAVHAPEAKRRSMRETHARLGQLTGQPFGCDPQNLAGLLALL